MRKHLNYANVVATLALFAAVGGTSYAALTITGKNVKNGSLTGKDIKNSSLTTSDVKNGSLLRADFKAGQIPAGAPGATGATGARGATGAAGSAVAYARVNADGTLDATRSKNITTSYKTGALATYCVRPSVPWKHMTATLDSSSGEIAAFFNNSVVLGCAANDAVVNTFTSAGNNASPGADRAFWVLFN